MTDDRAEITDTPPRSIIASCYALFRGTHAITFADMLIEELERNGWRIERIERPATQGEDE